MQIRALDTIWPERLSFPVNEKPAEVLSSEGKTIRLKIIDSELITLKTVAGNGVNTPRFNQIRILTR